MRWFGFQASPKKISSTVTALMITEETEPTQELAPGFGSRRTSSRMTFVSTRNVIEGLAGHGTTVPALRRARSEPLFG
jgi:hypothetical protein